MKRKYGIGLIVFGLWLAGCAPIAAPPSQGLPADAATAVETAATPTMEAAALEATAEPLQAPALAETPSATPDQAGGFAIAPLCTGKLTPADQEGPYYTPGSPEKASLIEPGMPGEAVLIQGYVFNQNCAAIAGAKVDFWQADANGVYDNAGFTLRGHALTDENGFYAIETIIPGRYPGRPPHIHVKIFAPDGRLLLTTQLYFPGSEASADVQAAPDLLVASQGVDAQGRQQVIFHFVVQE